MINDRFSRAWMVKSCIYCNLPYLEDVLPIILNFDYKKTIFAKYAKYMQNMHQWIWAFCSNIDLRGGRLHFLRGMNMQFPLITTRKYMQDKKYMMVVRCELKIPSFEITVRNQLANLLIEMTKECHSHKPQPIPGTKRKRKWTEIHSCKIRKCSKST